MASEAFAECNGLFKVIFWQPSGSAQPFQAITSPEGTDMPFRSPEQRRDEIPRVGI